MLKDVRNAFLSQQAAADAYGVVIDVQSWSVDAAATQQRREAMRAARGWTETPKVLWEDASSRADSAA